MCEMALFNFPTKEKPPGTPPPAAPAIPPLDPIMDAAPFPESCGTCRFWDRDKQSQVPGQMGAQQTIAPCRRYPITATLMTTLQKGIDGRGQVVMQPMQSPATVPTFSPSTEWCGEYQIETRASAYRARS